MHAVARCPVCDSSERSELAAFERDPYLLRLPGRRETTVRYAVCGGCGFVHQPEMMDETEMAYLYDGHYRPPVPPQEYLDGNCATAFEVFSWIMEHGGAHGAGRSVLDIGCAAGLFLQPFARTGWEAVGLDAGSAWIEYGRERLGLDLRSEFFTRDSFPGRRFECILFSHVLEHVFDPMPVLDAIREKLSDDGVLFIGTPNVLVPKRTLHPGLFGGDHVRLFSPRTLTAYLRRAGFRPIRIETFHGRGLRALCVKTGRRESSGPVAGDDGASVRALYRGLLQPDSSTVFERNLAGMVHAQWRALDAACRPADPSRYRADDCGVDPDQAWMRTPEGHFTTVYGAQGSRRQAAAMLRRLPDKLPGPVLLAGLGFGHLAEGILSRLGERGRLHIWEPNLDWFATVIRRRDLSALWVSPKVVLHVEDGLEDFMARYKRYDRIVSSAVLVEPVVSQARPALLSELEVWTRLTYQPKKPAAATHAPAPVAV